MTLFENSTSSCQPLGGLETKLFISKFTIDDTILQSKFQLDISTHTSFTKENHFWRFFIQVRLWVTNNGISRTRVGILKNGFNPMSRTPEQTFMQILSEIYFFLATKPPKSPRSYRLLELNCNFKVRMF